MSNRPKPKTGISPLRAALAAKTRLETSYRIPVRPTEEIEAAGRKVALARQVLAGAALVSDEAATLAQTKADEALAAYEACFHKVRFVGLTEEDFDALVQLHPPTPEQAAEDHLWHPDTFQWALVEACAQDSDLTAAEWQAEVSSWERAEKLKFLSTAMDCNRRTLSDTVPKD